MQRKSDDLVIKIGVNDFSLLLDLPNELFLMMIECLSNSSNGLKDLLRLSRTNKHIHDVVKNYYVEILNKSKKDKEFLHPILREISEHTQTYINQCGSRSNFFSGNADQYLNSSVKANFIQRRKEQGHHRTLNPFLFNRKRREISRFPFIKMIENCFLAVLSFSPFLYTWFACDDHKSSPSFSLAFCEGYNSFLKDCKNELVDFFADGDESRQLPFIMMAIFITLAQVIIAVLIGYSIKAAHEATIFIYHALLALIERIQYINQLNQLIVRTVQTEEAINLSHSVVDFHQWLEIMGLAEESKKLADNVPLPFFSRARIAVSCKHKIADVELGLLQDYNRLT